MTYRSLLNILQLTVLLNTEENTVIQFMDYKKQKTESSRKKGGDVSMSKKRIWIVFIIVGLLAGIVYLMPFFRFTFYDQMMEALTLTDTQIGILGSVYGTSYVVCFLPSGILSEKFSTKWLLFISAVGMAATSAWYATLPNFECLIVIHILYGIFSVGTFWSPYLKAIRNLSDDSSEGKMFGWSDSLRNVTNAIVSFGCLGIIGYAATSTSGFVGSCILNTVFAAVVAALIFIGIPNKFDELAKRDNNAVDEKKEGMLAVAKKVLVNPSTWMLIIFIMAGYTVWTTVNSYIGTFCVRVLNIDASIASTISIIRTYILALLAGLVGGFLLDKFSSRAKALFIAFIVAGVFAIGTMLSTGAAMICVVISLCLAFVVYVIKATYWSTMGEAEIAPENTGLATGVVSLIALTPDIFTPPVISAFLENAAAAGNIATGFNQMFIWIIVWCIIGATAGFLMVRRHKKLKMADLPEAPMD